MVRSELEAPDASPEGGGGGGPNGGGAGGRGGSAEGRSRGGKPRRYFRLEPAGVEALRESRERLLNMWDGVEEELETA